MKTSHFVRQLALGLSAVAIAMLWPKTGLAMVVELARCVTSDGQFEVVVDAERNDPRDPISHLDATIVPFGKNVPIAEFAAEATRSVHSISFGRPAYQDIKTDTTDTAGTTDNGGNRSGHSFFLEGPSTNFRNAILTAFIQTSDGLKVLHDENVRCSIFNGRHL